MRKYALFVLLTVSLACSVGILFVFQNSDAVGVSTPYLPVPAASNVAALKTAIVPETPEAVMRLAPDLRPASQGVYRLGDSGYAWLKNQSVCVLMNSGSGGCLEEFKEPSVVFLTSTPEGFRAEGVVPDQVAKLDLVLGDGRTVAASIEGNAYSIALPDGAEIAGEQVELRNGARFFNADHVSVN
jgi:hypothetical protein